MPRGNPNWKPGVSGNPKGRPKILPEIRAQARIDSPRAYARLAAEMENEDPRIAVPACVQVLRLAGVSFASEAEETKAQAEARRLTPEQIDSVLQPPALPLN